MKRLLPLVLSGLAIASWAGAAPSLRATPPGSFLKYRAPTVNELVYQTNRYSDVRAKYARHFGVRSEKVSTYFRTLKLVALKKPTKLQTWYYDKANTCRTRTATLPKGTLVFAAADGKPVLSWSCGNPLCKPDVETALKQYEKDKAAALAAKTKPKPAIIAKKPASQEEPPIETKVLADPPEIVTAPEVVTAPQVTPPVAAPEVAPAALPAPQVVAQLPDVLSAPAAAATEAVVSQGFNALPYLGGLAGIAGIIAATGGGGDDPGPLPVPVPEPSSVVALAAGIVGLVAVVRRRKAA